MQIILLSLKKLRPISQVFSFKLMIESEIKSIRILLVKITLNFDPDKHLLLILF